MADVKLRQYRSTNGADASQRATLRSLKLGRIGKTSTMTQTPQLEGMLNKVSHLVKVESD